MRHGDEVAQGEHQQTSTVLTNLLQSIEGINTAQVAELLSLQTSLSVFPSTTARLCRSVCSIILRPSRVDIYHFFRFDGPPVEECRPQ